MALIPPGSSFRPISRLTANPSWINEGKILDWTPMTGPTWGVAVDSSGTHGDSTLGNMDPAADWTLRPAALSFGSGWQLKTEAAGNDFIDFGTAAASTVFGALRQITVGWWGTFVTTVDDQLLVGKGANSPTHTFGFRLITVGSAGGWGFEVAHGTTDLRAHFDSSAKERITAGVPTFILATWTGGITASTSVTGYKNGAGPLTQLLSTNAVGARTDDSALPIRLFNHTDFHVAGSPNAYHSRIAVWSRVLAASEVRMLYAYPLWGVNYVPGSLVFGEEVVERIILESGEVAEDLEFGGPGTPGTGTAGTGGTPGTRVEYPLGRSSRGRIRLSKWFLGRGGEGGPGGAGDGWVGMSQMFKTGSLGSF